MPSDLVSRDRWLLVEKNLFFQLNAIFVAGDTTDSATPSTPLGPSTTVPWFPQAQMSKLAMGRGRDKQKGIFPPHGLRKTRASKMDARKPWGLGTPTGRNKTQLIKHRLGKLLPRPVLLARTHPAPLPPQCHCHSPTSKLPSRDGWFHGAAPSVMSPSLRREQGLTRVTSGTLHHLCGSRLIGS